VYQPRLLRYAKSAKSPVMAEIAAIAYAKGYRQQTLAKLLGCSAPAIIRHFNKMRSSEPVLRGYAQRLRIPDEYLSLLSYVG